MAKDRGRTDPPKPIYPVAHEFRAAFDNFSHQAGMLADSVQLAIDTDGAINNAEVKRILKERLAAFSKARFGDEE